MNQVVMREIDLAFTEWPFLGVRQMQRYLRLLGYSVGIKRVRRPMRLMGLIPIYQKFRAIIPYREHRRYPDLLRDLAITGPHQVRCSDRTYIPMRKGFLCLVAIMDWHSRKVLSWRLSSIMDTDFCVVTLEEALAKYSKLGIFNTDQGSQCTSFVFTSVLRENGIHISMDGRGHWLGNVFIERLWRSLKYECVYLNAFETGSEARAGIGRGIACYNRLRPHTALGGITPNMCYEQNVVKAA